MNGFILMIPLFIIRFGLLRIVNKEALNRAAFFAPLKGVEKTMYYFYFISNLFVILYPFLLKVQTEKPLFYIALFVYLLGIGILIISTVSFGSPNQNGINVNGIYKISRNARVIIGLN